MRPEQSDIDARLRLLTEAGIDAQILRLQNVSGVDAFPPAEGLELAQAANEEIAGIAKRHPQRFIPYASVPMRDINMAVGELERAVKTLGHRGVGVSVSVDGVPLDHPRFAPFIDAVAQLDVPLILLPNHPSLIDAELQPYGWLTGAFGFQVDLSLVALRLACAGTFERHPRLKVVLANLGGVFPFVLDRLDHYWQRMNAGTRPLPAAPRDVLRRYFVETASAHPAAIRMTAEVIGVDRIVFGSDYPSFDFRRAIDSVRGCGLPPEQVEMILRRNAQALLAA